MKKSLILSILVLVVLGLTTAAFAERYSKSLGVTSITVQGTISSVDTVNKKIVIKEEMGGGEYTLAFRSDAIHSFNTWMPKKCSGYYKGCKCK